MKLPSFDPTSNKQISSDPIMTFAINHSNGNLTRVQEFAAGGMWPRQFSISNDGSMIAVGLQKDGRVVILDRDVQTGLLTEFRASIDVGNEPTCVVFKEEALSVPIDIMHTLESCSTLSCVLTEDQLHFRKCPRHRRSRIDYARPGPENHGV